MSSSILTFPYLKYVKVIIFSCLLSACGGATPKVIAYNALWNTCLEVEKEIEHSPQSADDRWAQLQAVRDVCDRAAQRVRGDSDE